MAGLAPLDAGLAGAVAGFTTRSGGVSRAPWDSLNLASHVGDEVAHVRVNSDRLAEHLGVEAVGFPHQVHGADVLVVDRAGPGLGSHTAAGGVDALVTMRPGVAIGVLVADCMPVLFDDPIARVVGAAHAGRRGLASGVLQATVAAMADLGAVPARMHVVVGPAICGGCYEVPEAMQAEVAAIVPASASRTRAGTAGLDLPAGAVEVLRSAGVGAVSSTGICTAEDQRFYSYRRDGLTGRFAGFVMLER